MILWRISRHRELDGAGGLRAAGRWHTRGSPIIYCAPNPGSALVEVLVHIELDLYDLPDPLQYLEIEIPDTTSIETLATEALAQTWSRDIDLTRRAGDDWLRSRRTALLRVPSVVVPQTWNVLINPMHSDTAHARVARIHTHSLDRRLRR